MPEWDVNSSDRCTLDWHSSGHEFYGKFIRPNHRPCPSSLLPWAVT